MIIKKYGIKLERLTEKDIELVRTMRNEDRIRSKMFYQKVISKEEQVNWFNSINNDYNYYFLIIHKEKRVGLIHGKVLSYDKRVSEGGIFIWDEESLNSAIPIIASICMADVTFYIMEMRKTKAVVRADNKKALDYNQQLGYQIISNDEKEQKIYMELSKDDYLKTAQKIRKTVKKITKDNSDISWDDIEVSKNPSNELYTQLPDYLKIKVDEKLRETK